MKFSLIALSTIIIAAAVSTQSANAQEPQGRTRGARFDFAPNYYRVEQPNLPRHGNQVPSHNVRSGSMPKASNFLVDADMLKKQAPVAAPIIAQHVNSQAFIPNTAYHPSFGQPNSLMPTAASAMPQQMAKPKATTVARAPHRAASVRRSNSNVAGRLVKRPPAQSVVADYGKNFGYVPGSTLPSRQPDVSSRQEVSGKVLRY